MLIKLAWYSTKGKLKDYVLLFSGLIMASAIFYMFQSIARNNRLVNTSIFTLVFQLGSVLLGVITFFYLLYANSFLMNLKRKEYGMLLMLGATKFKIVLLNFLETIGIGLVATLMGNLVGILLSKVVTLFLQNGLSTQLTSQSFVNFQAFLITLIFFVVCFILTAILNGRSLAKEELTALLKKQATPDYTDDKSGILILQFFSGSLCLGFGYYAMFNVINWKMKAIVIAMFTIFLGSYLLIHSLVILVLNGMKQRKPFYLKKLNTILVAQLKYRIKSYTQILTVIAMLFALALGALTVGLGFKNEGYKIADKMLYYDLVLTSKNSQELDKMSQANLKSKSEYHFKIAGNRILINENDFEKTPFIVNTPISAQGTVVYECFNADALRKSDIAQESFKKMLADDWQKKDISFVSQNDFNLSNDITQAIILVKTTSFKKNYKTLDSIVKALDASEISPSMQKVSQYKAYEKNLVPFEYMGFFLGIAFLTMLTCCLMFKILTSYKTDQERYDILTRIGATKSGISSVIGKELLIIFTIPAFLGTLHVLFGLQLFKILLTNPYDAIAIPIMVFLMIYFVYFYLTYKMYSKIIFHKSLG
ncbi:ABC transporter permease [Pseudolactococcus yaeyamensis]